MRIPLLISTVICSGISFAQESAVQLRPAQQSHAQQTLRQQQHQPVQSRPIQSRQSSVQPMRQRNQISQSPPLSAQPQNKHRYHNSRRGSTNFQQYYPSNGTTIYNQNFYVTPDADNGLPENVQIYSYSDENGNTVDYYYDQYGNIIYFVYDEDGNMEKIN